MSIIGEAATAKVTLPEPSGSYYKPIIDENGYVVGGKLGNYTRNSMPISGSSHYMFVTKFANSTSGCTGYGTGLKSISIPQTITTLAGFAGNSNLEYVHIPSTVTSIQDSCFKACHHLDLQYLPNSLTTIGKDAFKSCYVLSLSALPSGVTSIGTGAFAECRKLTLTTIPSGVTVINSNTFYGCSSMTSFIVPEGVTSIGADSFYESGVKIVDIASTVSSIGSYVFTRSKLEDVILRQTTVIDYPTGFINSSTLKHIYVPSELVNTYKTTTGWSTYASKIFAIS